MTGVTETTSLPPRAVSANVARNGALYFFSLAVPAVVALFLVPVTVHALGPARFGLLALAWAVAESTGVFDFGLGKATVKFVADATVKGRERLGEIVNASLVTQTGMGCVAGVVLFLLAPLLVHRVFSIAPQNQAEAIGMFRVLAIHMPVLLWIASLRAALEGAQRFDYSTALRIPSTLASVIVPAWAATQGFSLGSILWILLFVRVVLAVLTALAVRRVLLTDRWRTRLNAPLLREMLRYSSWVAISTFVGTILATFDRFAVGGLVGGVGLGYYSGAAEGANRFLLVPVTAFTAVLPALSAADAAEGSERSIAVARAAQRQLGAVLFPLCAVLFVFGPSILRLWLGESFAVAAGSAFRILAVGIFFAGLAILSLAVLYGAGRPDLPAKINLVQVALYVPASVLLIRGFGLTGAAIAVTLMRLADLVGYELAVRLAIGRVEANAAERSRKRLLIAAAMGLFALLVMGSLLQTATPSASLLLALLAVVAYAWIAWTRGFTARERQAWLSMIPYRRGSLRAEMANSRGDTP